MEKEKFNFSNWVKVHVAEFKRIIWPARKDISKQTIMVILISLAFGAIIYGFDLLISYGFNALSLLLG